MSVQNMPSPFTFFTQLRKLREIEEEQAKSNPFLAQALEDEKKQGHRLAVIARTIALGLVAILLPFLNMRFDVIFYEVAVLFFIALGWLQLRMSSVGYSRVELVLILSTSAY